MIIRSSTELRTYFHQLQSNDIFIGLLPATHVKSAMLVDLLERGIHCLPSPLSQVLNSSKVAQALVLKDWMIPHTLVIRRRTDLMEAIGVYSRLKVAAVVTKQDHLHCGHGIRQWRSIEDLYSHMALADDSYPFVLQPSLQKFDDVRVVMVEDYTEAYQRCNRHNFRKNISCGAHGLPYKLDEAQIEFCRSAMRRAKFPYAHLDLLISEEGTCRLSEISLNGGLRGAAIRRDELERRKKRCLTKLAEQLSKQV